MKPLSKQQQKVLDYIREHAGCTTRDIINDTYVTCVSGRITEIRQAGYPIISIGQKKYAGSKAFECYALQETKQLQLV